MTKVHRTPCPLCLNPTPINHIDKVGCPTCESERIQLLRDRSSTVIEKAQKKQEAADARAKSFKKYVDGLTKKREAAAEQAALDAEKKRVFDANKEQASLNLAKRSLLHYVERRKPDYKSHWPHELIAAELERFMYDVEAGEHPRLLLLCSSRMGKSELASNSFPAWLLGHHPNWEILLCSASDALPSEFSRNIREQIRSDEYRSIFPTGASLRADSSAALRWSTEQGGGIKAVGSKGTILGFGFNVGIFDDIHKSQEELDNPERSKDVWDWFSSIAYSRQLPGAGIIVIMQRLADEDLAGRLMKRQKDDEDRIKELRRDAAELAEESIEGMDDPIVKEMLSEADEMDESIDRWRIVEFPALAKADEYFDNETHDIIHYPSGYTPDDLSLRPLRKAGEALHPARYSRNYYLKIKRNNPREFAAMFQLTPQIDETAYFNIHQIKRYKPADRPKLDSMDVVTAWDLAIGTKQYNDHTVGLALARDHKRRVWLLDRIRGRWDDIRIVSDLIIDLHVKWNSTITGIEKMMVEQTMGPILRAKMEERQDYINLAEGQEALKPITDKAVRARTFQNWVNGGLVYVPEGEDWDDYISILSRFLVSNIDDDTDASAWGAILLNRTSPPEDPKEANRRQRDMDEEYDDDELLGSTSRSYMEA